VRLAAALMALAAATLAMLCSGSGPAAAAGRPVPTETTGPCTASFAGVDIADRSATDPDDAIEVEPDDKVVVTVSAPTAVGHYSIELGFAGFYWTVAEDDTDDAQWERTVNVDDYAWLGGGLYQIRAVSDGDVPCTGSVLVLVGGSPFTTLGGWVALVLTGAGIVAAVIALRKPRAGAPIGGIVLGALGGLGVVLLLQQFGQAFPTRVVVVTGVLGGAAIVLIAHLIGRSTAGKVVAGVAGSAAPTQSPAPAPPPPPAPAPTATPDSWAAPTGPVTK